MYTNFVKPFLVKHAASIDRTSEAAAKIIVEQTENMCVHWVGWG